jgi:TPR repeat protein
VTLRGNEPSPAGVPARANGADALPDELQELQAAAAAGDGAAAFTLWERLRDSDFAAAEGWLRTAVELGDARGAHRLGMLLWERRELDAAEATLRSATANPEGAYALGRLLWRERNDPRAAIHWLDRAAQADDPAAERDLGIALREHGDLHGAHYWLSRAADRDGEARHVLAELDADQ